MKIFIKLNGIRSLTKKELHENSDILKPLDTDFWLDDLTDKCVPFEEEADVDFRLETPRDRHDITAYIASKGTAVLCQLESFDGTKNNTLCYPSPVLVCRGTRHKIMPGTVITDQGGLEYIVMHDGNLKLNSVIYNKCLAFDVSKVMQEWYETYCPSGVLEANISDNCKEYTYPELRIKKRKFIWSEYIWPFLGIMLMTLIIVALIFYAIPR